MADQSICKIEGCGKPTLIVSRQLCSTHYEKWKRYGDPLKGRQLSENGGRLPRPTCDDPASQEPYWRWARMRFAEKIERDAAGCWNWKGGFFSGKPYGQFSAVRNWRAHRFAYAALRGPIPDGMVLDHLCRNPACVNPSHLEPVTDAVNILRGEGAHAKNARKTHCHRGHEFTPENTRMTAGGGRYCLACKRIETAKSRANRTPDQIERDRLRQLEYDRKRRPRGPR